MLPAGYTSNKPQQYSINPKTGAAKDVYQVMVRIRDKNSFLTVFFYNAQDWFDTLICTVQ
jgi:hypothetical protein